jgi:hypothetical protein
MDYYQSFPDIYYDPYIIKNDAFEIIEDEISINDWVYNYFYYSLKLEKNTLFVLIKTNIENAFIYDIKIYDKLIYFCSNDKKLNIRLRDYREDFQNKYMKIYQIIKKKNTKYIIHNEPIKYYSEYKNMLLFKRFNNMLICTFTINIHLFDIKNRKYYKIKDSELDLIKLKSKNFIFIYKPILLDRYNIVLYLIGIKNITNNNEIFIDIKFIDIESIYKKYEIALDEIKKFVFNSEKELNYEIEVKYLETKIKGIYYPNTISI